MRTGQSPGALANVRAWQVYLREHPLHDAHVQAFKVVAKGKHWVARTCRACGQEVWPLQWPRDKGGHTLSHCGCRSPGAARQCRACGANYVPTCRTPSQQKFCPGCGPTIYRDRRLKEKRRTRERQAAKQGRTLGPSSLPKYDAHIKAWDRWRRKLHDAHVKAWRACDARIARWRTKHDTAYLLNLRLRVAIRKAMKGKKAGRAWESIVGYSLDDLLRHMERMLPKRYTLADFHNGRLHIDHIVPKSTFDMTTIEGVRAAWALPNLQPLPAKANLKKSDRVLYLL